MKGNEGLSWTAFTDPAAVIITPRPNLTSAFTRNKRAAGSRYGALLASGTKVGAGSWG